METAKYIEKQMEAVVITNAIIDQSIIVNEAREAHRIGAISSEMIYDIETNAFEVREKVVLCLHEN